VRHVGLNLVFMVPGETGGMEIAARALIPALRAAAPGLRFTAFVNREAAGEDVGADRVVVPVHAANRVQWVRGEQFLLPRLAARAGCEIVHSMGSTAPAAGRFARVTTIHDLNYRMVPEAHFGLRALGMRALVPLAARRSHRVLADSSNTRDDVVRHLGVPAGKVEVVPLGLGRPPSGPRTPPAELRERLRLGDRRVLLSLAAKRPHKNLAGLLDALALIPADRRPVAVLPGYATPHEQELRERAARLGIGGDVRFEGWLPERDVEGLFALANVFVFPSFYEGFGLPVLEAMARGVPVACADRSSLPEVAGEAAVLFDPGDTGSIAAAVERLLTDEQLAARLRQQGRTRAALFTWERTAELTLAAYERALRSVRPRTRGSSRRD
jgi:glycosyltransferase involved in cell wall biosynthesis